MFINPPRNINEKAFCDEYIEKEKRFKKTPDYSTAVDLLRISSEEYKAFETIKSTLTTGNYMDQLSLTSFIIEQNPNSYCAWLYRTYLMQRIDLVGAIDSVYLEDTYFIQKVLRADNRNMHAWIHIAVIYNYSTNIVKNELSKSISNFSAYFATIKNETYLTIDNRDVESIVFTDPVIASPWVFIRMTETLRRLNGTNAYIKKYSNRLCIYLKTPGKTKVYIKHHGKVMKYLAEFKKTFSLYWEKEGFTFEEIESIKIQTKAHKEVEIDLSAPLPCTLPPFIDKFMEKHPTVESYITKMSFALDSETKDAISTELIRIDPLREQMYLEMKEEYSVYSALPPKILHTFVHDSSSSHK